MGLAITREVSLCGSQQAHVEEQAQAPVRSLSAERGERIRQGDEAPRWIIGVRHHLFVTSTIVTGMVRMNDPHAERQRLVDRLVGSATGNGRATRARRRERCCWGHVRHWCMFDEARHAPRSRSGGTGQVRNWITPLRRVRRFPSG